MIFAEKSQLMLKYQKAKAKLVEFDVAKEDYPHFPLNSNDLSFSSTYILSRYAESVIENDYNTKSELGVYVRNVAQYFDAAVGSKDRNKYDVDFLLSGATAYFFSNNFGSSKVLLRKAFQKVDVTQKTAKAFLTRLLAFLFDNYPMEYMRNEDDYSLLNNAVKVYFETGENCQNIKMLSEKYRKDVYNKDDIDEVFFGDLSLAILFLSIEQSAWRLLPNYTELPSEKWRDYLRGKNGLKMLWPAQQLIGNSNILRGMNGIVQLPTGVGKTKSIELIIRSAFIEQRASIVVIVAPLRALCNEITMDMIKAFGRGVKINQFSDVLQEDVVLFDDSLGKQIVVCTPEKLSYIVHHQKDIIDMVDLFVFDEAHMFDDGVRGAVYELLMTHIRSVTRENQQIVLMSAVLSNAEKIKEWLFGQAGVLATDSQISSTPKSIAFVSDSSDMFYFSDNPSKYDYYIPRIIKKEKLKKKVKEHKDRFFPENSANDIAIFNTLKLCRNGGVAIYVGRQSSIITVMKRIIELNLREFDLSPFLADVNSVQLEKLSNLFSEYYGSENIYTKCSRVGVVAHSSNIPNGLKLAVEYALKQKHIQIVVCTSTLAQGVNIPIRYLIVTTLRADREFMKIRNFQNLIGRTARSGIFTEGSIIITDPKIYDERERGRGYYNWKMCSDMFNSNASEPCSSSILKLVQKIQVDYDFPVSAEKFVKYYIEHIEEEDVIDTLTQRLVAAFLKQYPERKKHNIYEELGLRKNTLEAIESYLFLALENVEERDRFGIAKTVCRDTLAYSLASDQEKNMLETIFEAIVKKINSLVGADVSRYTFSMSGVELSKKISGWLSVADITKMLKTEEDCLTEIITFYKETFNPGKYKEQFDYLCRLWINGVLPKQMSDLTGIQVCDIDDICNKKISYELNFLIGNICDMLDNDMSTEIERLKDMLNILQKRVKYGVATKTAVSICETIFNDRILATKLANIIGDDNISSEKLLEDIKHNKEEIFSKLEQYPAYFEDRLKFLL